MDRESLLIKKYKKKWFFKNLNCKILSFFPFPKLIELNSSNKKSSDNHLLFPRLLRFTTYFRKSENKFFKKEKKNLRNLIPIYIKLKLNPKLHKSFIPFFFSLKEKSSKTTFFEKISREKRKTLILWFIGSLNLFSPLENFFLDKFLKGKKNLENSLFFSIESQKLNFNFIKNKIFKRNFTIEERKNFLIQKTKMIAANVENFKIKKTNYASKFHPFSLNLRKKNEKHYQLKISKKSNDFFFFGSVLLNKNLIFFGEKKKINSLKIKQILDKKFVLFNYKFSQKRIIFFDLNVNNIFNLYNFSFIFFKNYSIKYFPNSLEIFLGEEKGTPTFSKKKGILNFQKYSVKFLLNKKIRKRYNKINVQKRNLSFFFLKENQQNYLVFDQDFFFGFIIDFGIKKISQIKPIAGFLKFEKLKDKNVKAKEKGQKKFEINLSIKFLLLKDLLVEFLSKKRKIILFNEINSSFLNPEIFIQHSHWLSELKFFKKQIDEVKVIAFEMKNYLNFKSIIREFWKKETRIFFWDFPKIETWNIRKSKNFQRHFLEWYTNSFLLERKVIRQNNLKKIKEEIFFDFKKWAIKKKTKKLLGKKIIQKKLIEFKKNIKLIKNYQKKKTKYSGQIFQKDLKLLKIKEKLFKNFYFSDYIFFIQKKINYLGCFFYKTKLKAFNPLKNKSQNFLFKKAYFEKELKKGPKANFRVGFSIFSNKTSWIVFSNYGAIFCFISKKYESSFYKLNFAEEKKKKIFLKKFFFFRFKGIEILPLQNFYRPFEQNFDSVYLIQIKKIIKKILFLVKKLTFSLNKFDQYPKEEDKSSKITKNIKENFSLENFLFFFKNEPLTGFYIYKNYMKNKIDFDFKTFFLKKFTS